MEQKTKTLDKKQTKEVVTAGVSHKEAQQHKGIKYASRLTQINQL